MQPMGWTMATALVLGVTAGPVTGRAQDKTPAWPIVLNARAEAAQWRWLRGDWACGEGALNVSWPETARMAIASPRMALVRNRQAVETTVRVTERLTPEGWSFAGVVIAQDETALWLLALTQAPDGTRYVDFLESFAGVWQAQNSPEYRLPAGEGRTRVPWEPGVPYRLRLVLGDDDIQATVHDARDGRLVAQGSYRFAHNRAVRDGFPALVARGCQASWEGLNVAAPPRPAPRADIQVESGPKGALALLGAALAPEDDAVGREIARSLRRAGYGVTVLSADQACQPGILAPDRFPVYIVPNCDTYPAPGVPVLTAYARAGGHVVVLGGPLFDRLAYRFEGDWLTRQDLADRKARLQPTHAVWDPARPETLPEWQRATSNADAAGSWTPVEDGPRPGQWAMRYRTEHYSGWDGYLSSDIDQLFGENHDLLSFQLKADDRTPRIAVEIQERDGSRWIATVTASTEWEPVALSPSDFRYWQDSPTKDTRGGALDALAPARAVRINFGLANTHTPAVPAGAHTFWIAGLGTTTNPFADVETMETTVPSLETLHPAYKCYPLQGVTAVRAAGGVSWVPNANYPVTDRALSAIPRLQGRGWRRGHKWRWMPLLEASDRGGAVRGTPAWLLLNDALPYTGSVFGALAYQDPEALLDPPCLALITAMIDRIQRGGWLSEAGSEHFAYWPGETQTVGARVTCTRDKGLEGQVSLEVLDQDDRECIQLTEPVAIAGRGTETVSTTWALPQEPGEYTVRVVLTDDDGNRIDRIEHTFAVLDTEPAPRSAFVTVEGSEFMLEGRPWRPIGINFWPLYVSGMDRPDYWAGWLDSRFYEPEEVERDLERLEALGIDLVSIQTGGLRFHRNLLDFLRRCARRDIKANLFVGEASPLAFREEQLHAFITTARLAENPTVFAYDTIWEPGNYVFRGDGRDRWDTDWHAWIVERYDTVQAAEADWGTEARRTEAGTITSPPDRWFSEDGPWRVQMAAYRRFMDDLMSAKWNHAHRTLRRIDPNHLISFRQGNTLPHDFTFTATPRHIDFICPEGYAIPGSEDGYYAAGFITRYIHFTTGGKPILWSEFGKSVWNGSAMTPSTTAISYQAEYHELFYRMVLESGANGTVPWWWPGGYRVGERSDFGIINPDGTPRPSARLVAEYGPKIRALPGRPAATAWYEMDRDAHAGGYWRAAFNEGRDAYRAAIGAGGMLGIRTKGTGTTSLTTPLVAVGNTRCTGHNPPKFLNAEFNWLQILAADGTWVEARDGAELPVKGGKPVRARASVGNTQEAAWIPKTEAGRQPGAVRLSSTLTSALTVSVPIPRRVKYLGEVDLGEFTLAESITAETHVELQMDAAGRTPFGEKRTFVLRPVAVNP